MKKSLIIFGQSLEIPTIVAEQNSASSTWMYVRCCCYYRRGGGSFDGLPKRCLRSKSTFISVMTIFIDRSLVEAVQGIAFSREDWVPFLKFETF